MMIRPSATLLAATMLLLAGCVTPRADYDQLKASYDQTQAANRKLESENQALQSQLTQQVEHNTYTVAVDLLFTPGNFDITPNGQAALNDIIGRLRGLKDSRIVVYGHTDDQNVGPPLRKQGINSNMELSSRRADAVAAYLRGHGINPAMVSAKGMGETHPVAPNDSPAGRARNRRIEIVVGGPG